MRQRRLNPRPLGRLRHDLLEFGLCGVEFRLIFLRAPEL